MWKLNAISDGNGEIQYQVASSLDTFWPFTLTTSWIISLDVRLHPPLNVSFLHRKWYFYWCVIFADLSLCVLFLLFLFYTFGSLYKDFNIVIFYIFFFIILIYSSVSPVFVTLYFLLFLRFLTCIQFLILINSPVVENWPPGQGRLWTEKSERVSIKWWKIWNLKTIYTSIFFWYLRPTHEEGLP